MTADAIEVVNDDSDLEQRSDFLRSRLRRRRESAAERGDGGNRSRRGLLYGIDREPPACLAAVLGLQVRYALTLDTQPNLPRRCYGRLPRNLRGSRGGRPVYSPHTDYIARAEDLTFPGHSVWSMPFFFVQII